MKTITYQREPATGIEELRYIVQQLLHWNDEQFGMYVYETGLEYCAAYFGRDQKTIDQVTRRKEFWNWWKLHWYKRDQCFVEFCQMADGFEDEPLTVTDRLIIYHDLHRANVLACEIYPNRIVLGSDFHTVKMQMK